MSSVWLTLLKFALNVAITAVGQIPASKWEALGTIIAAWLQRVEDTLPAGNPLTTMAHFYRAAPSKLNRIRPDDE